MNLKDQISFESHLWNKFRNGDHDSFEEIYRTNIISLLQYGIKLTRDGELVKDCIHELFVELYNHRDTLGPTTRIKPYLITCLKRKIHRTLSSNQKNISLNIEELPFLIDFSMEKIMESEETEQEKKQLLKNALDNLSSRQREAIYLRFIEGLDYDEISEVLELNYQSARNLIHRGTERLREIIVTSNINLLQ